MEAVRADNRAAREAVPYLTDDKTQSHPTEGNPETHHHGGPQEPRPHGWVKSSLRFSARQIQSPPRGVAGGKFDYKTIKKFVRWVSKLQARAGNPHSPHPGKRGAGKGQCLHLPSECNSFKFRALHPEPHRLGNSDRRDVPVLTGGRMQTRTVSAELLMFSGRCHGDTLLRPPLLIFSK